MFAAGERYPAVFRDEPVFHAGKKDMAAYVIEICDKETVVAPAVAAGDRA